mmetsp:Transcript_111980/g.321780  ORF Transcript_111980/g.321780 Transcript_111980/m.321780 type:complete len:265 (+) Transcript_111980:991-1785(+)
MPMLLHVQGAMAEEDDEEAGDEEHEQQHDEHREDAHDALSRLRRERRHLLQQRLVLRRVLEHRRRDFRSVAAGNEEACAIQALLFQGPLFSRHPTPAAAEEPAVRRRQARHPAVQELNRRLRCKHNETAQEEGDEDGVHRGDGEMYAHHRDDYQARRIDPLPDAHCVARLPKARAAGERARRRRRHDALRRGHLHTPAAARTECLAPGAMGCCQRRQAHLLRRLSRRRHASAATAQLAQGMRSRRCPQSMGLFFQACSIGTNSG